MLLNEINPYVRLAIIGTISSKTKYDVFFKLKTSDCRLFYILSGKGSIVIKNTQYTLHSGDCILFQSGTEYIWQPEENSNITYISINFDYTQNHSYIKKSFHPVHHDMFFQKDLLENINFQDSQILNNYIFITNCFSLENYFRQLVNEYYIGGNYSDESLSSLLKSIIISIVRKYELKKINSDKDFELTKNIMQYIYENYNKELSYTNISKIFHLNPIYINRLFKKNSGVSLHSFIINYRINMAMELLRSTKTDIKEIAYMVGFTDVPHFTKTFKTHVNTTPTKYRNSNNF